MFGTQLTVTWPPNTTGLPPDANPAYNPLTELLAIKCNEMKTANTLGNIIAGNLINRMVFVDSASALEYQNYLTEVLIDLNQAVPEFAITTI